MREAVSSSWTEMDHLLQIAALALLALSFTCLLQLLVKRRKSVAHHLTFPPGPPGSLPILGHLPFLSSGCPHRVLAHLSHAPPPSGLGPIIGLRLGTKYAVVICNSHLAKEVLHTHDKILANRPHLTLSDHLFYGFNTSIAFTTYNPRWAMLRKLCSLELFTPKRLQSLQNSRYGEVRGLLQGLHEASHAGKQAVDLGEFFVSMNCNSIGRFIHSKTLAEAGGQNYASILKHQEKCVAPTIGDFLPWLKILDVIPKRTLKNVHQQIDRILETMISQRRQLLKSKRDDEPLPQDLLQVLLSREATNQQSASTDEDERLHINEIKGTILDVMSAGIHSTALTLEWAMAELLRNPRCMHKLRAEIDSVTGVGPDRFITDEDLPQLPYLENVVKEVLRLYPAAPLMIAHVGREAIQVEKYILPAETLVFVNVWAIGRDPDVWKNSDEFQPERFEGKEIDVKGQHYDLLPFGSGRRVCPGLCLALSVLHVTLANLIRTFEWELPNGQKPQELDMSEQRGFTITRSTPLLAIPKNRFDA